MADLQLELLRRNARLRAWRAVGVPIEGGWALRGRSSFSWGHLRLRCSACGRSDNDGAAGSAGMVAHAERLAIRQMLTPDLPNPCPGHLAPLLGEDPPEVLAILELELLAGEGPR
jgi:hypothetical protein